MEATTLQAALRTTAMATVPNAKNSVLGNTDTHHSYTAWLPEQLVLMNPAKPTKKEVPEHPEGCIFRPSGFAGLERFPYSATRGHTATVVVRSVVGVHGDAGRAAAFVAGNELRHALPSIKDAINAEMETYATENDLTVIRTDIHFATLKANSNPFGFTVSGDDLVSRLTVRVVVVENQTVVVSTEDLETLFRRYGVAGKGVRDYGVSNGDELIAYAQQMVATAHL